MRWRADCNGGGLSAALGEVNAVKNRLATLASGLPMESRSDPKAGK